MRFAKIVFLVAGIYGLIVLLPTYFMEERTGHDYPPPITHPEYYYGFVGLAVVWQIVFLILSRDPVRYRPLMIPAILEKAVFCDTGAYPVVAASHSQRGVWTGDNRRIPGSAVPDGVSENEGRSTRLTSISRLII